MLHRGNTLPHLIEVVNPGACYPVTSTFRSECCRIFWAALFVVVSLPSHSQDRPKIGLTLSGGGAKGIAHIGILQAIDSAGLNIDYITGTSMGSVMGALYAAGYSGNEMEKIARELDWIGLFSGKPRYEYVNMDEKAEFDQYAIEVPFEKGKLKLTTGAIEGQEIWLKFQELLMPVYNIKDFSMLSIPFKCIATDVGTGAVVVLDHGEIVTAIRASMAIPSVFTAIDHGDTKLVDGGVVRNFPVSDVVAMGADYTIGVNLSQGLQKAEDLTTAVDILYQIAFYKDADDFQQERKLCNILVEPPVEDYSAASFTSVEELLKIGKEWGRKYYPQFRKLVDSIKKIDPTYQYKANRLPKPGGIVVDEFEIKGLQHTSKEEFLKRLDLRAGSAYNGEQIALAIRRVYGTRNYNRVAYYWQPTTQGHARMILDVIESPQTYLKVGLHYHIFSNVALVTTIARENLLPGRSNTILKLNLSENFRGLGQHNQSFGRHDANNFIASFYYEAMKLPLYNNFEQTYLYRSHFTQSDIKIQHTFGQRAALGLGTAYETYSLIPKIAGQAAVEAGNGYFHSYVFYNLTTVDQKHFSREGWNVYGRLGGIYRQRPDDVFYQIGETAGIIDTLSFKNYGQFRLNIENFLPLSPKVSLISQLNGGMNFKSGQSYLNFFNVGGLTDFLRNQVTFAGLSEFQVKTNSIGVVALGIQVNPFKSLYTSLRANVALHDFAFKSGEFDRGQFLSGYALTIGYHSAIGPLQFSTIYSDQSKKFLGYVNVGMHF
jgi:NTE family protein